MEAKCPLTPSELRRAAGHPSWGSTAVELILLQGYQIPEKKDEFSFLFPKLGGPLNVKEDPELGLLFLSVLQTL